MVHYRAGDDILRNFIIVFNSVMTRNRVAHLRKLLHRLSIVYYNTNHKGVVFLYRLNKDTLEDVLKIRNLFYNVEILVLDSIKPITSSGNLKRSTLEILREWILTLVQTLRLVRHLDKPWFLFMGSEEAPLVFLASLISRSRVAIFAGGFAYHNFLQASSSLRDFLRSRIAFLVETIVILLTRYVLVESKNVQYMVPLHKLVRRKIICDVVLGFESDKAWLGDVKSIGVRSFDISYIGALEPYRNIPLIICILKALIEKMPSMRALLIGDGSLRPYVEKKLKEFGLTRNVVFLNYVNPEEVIKFLDDLKILLFLSKSEGLPNIVLEAMARGVVVISTPIGGISDVLNDGITGISVSRMDINEITSRIISILQGGDILKFISRSAHEYIKNKYCSRNLNKQWYYISLLVSK